MDKFSESIKALNDYRNLYHAESSSTEQYKVANAINDILPKFCELIENDAEPVVHGHWIHNTDDFTPKKRCSYCGYNKPVVAGENIEQEPDDYCNNCGTKMDEEATTTPPQSWCYVEEG